MATSNPGYGAVPPLFVGSAVPYITTTITGEQSHSGGAVRFAMDGTITTPAGTITANDWVSVIKVMKQLVIDMSKDQELASKYPYIRDVAHSWMMEELKGGKNGNKEEI